MNKQLRDMKIELINKRNEVTLVERLVDLGTITFEDFKNELMADFNNACELYDEINKAGNKAAKQHIFDYKMKEAQKYAELKWKTEKRRNQYIEERRKQILENLETNRSWEVTSKGIFFDFDPNPGANFIPGVNIIKRNVFNEENEEFLRRAFKNLVNSKYFRKAKGWKFRYQGSNEKSLHPYSSAFRPSIELILDENVQRQLEAEEKSLADAIHSFYSRSNYWGD